MKRKFWIILLAIAGALCLCFGFAACGGGGPKEKKVNLGDSPEQVVKLLGEPYEEESSETFYRYYSKDYLSILQKSADLEKKLMTTTSAKELEKLLTEMVKLETRLSTLVYTKTEITFSRNEEGELSVSRIWYDAACNENAPEKTFAGVQLDGVKKCSHEDLVQGTIDGIGITERYTDGSYRTTPPEDWEVDFYAEGKNVGWGLQYDGVWHRLSSSSLKAPIPLGMIATGIYGKTGAYTTPNNGMTEIGDYAFRDCDWITSFVIRDSVTSIGEGAFSGCSGLTSITIPESGVTSIGSSAFEGCSGLTSITIPDGVTSIGSSAFEGCSGLTSITIPYSVTSISIGDYAFEGCSGLESVTIDYGVTSIGEGAFANCTSLTSITIPDRVSSIGESAFSGCSSLETITISESVALIGEYAFYHCDSLETITIPEGVTSIEGGTFWGCHSLTSIVIPNSVTSIGNSAFSDCSGLTNIVIPNSVTSIGDSAFSGCRGLKAVYYKGTADEWGNISIDNGYSDNFYLLNATRYYFTEDAPTAEEWAEWNYWWHFDETTGEVVVWVKPQA